MNIGNSDFDTDDDRFWTVAAIWLTAGGRLARLRGKVPARQHEKLIDITGWFQTQHLVRQAMVVATAVQLNRPLPARDAYDPDLLASKLHAWSIEMISRRKKWTDPVPLGQISAQLIILSTTDGTSANPEIALRRAMAAAKILELADNAFEFINEQYARHGFDLPRKMRKSRTKSD